MWIWSRLIKPALEWTGHYESVQAILHTEAYKHFIAPLVSGGTVAVLGVTEQLPLMWVAMATSVVVMAVATTRVRLAEWAERNNPEHKLILTGANLAFSLEPIDVPEKVIGTIGNRSARRSGSGAKQIIPAHTLRENEFQPGIEREIEEAQVGIKIKNVAPFPMSVILQFSETEVAGKKPPRSTFPKQPSTIPPGEEVHINDDPIKMDGYPCGRLAGKLKMVVKYGRVGKEVFELDLRADLDIVMEDWGIVHQVAAAWKGR